MIDCLGCSLRSGSIHDLEGSCSRRRGRRRWGNLGRHERNGAPHATPTRECQRLEAPRQRSKDSLWGVAVVVSAEVRSASHRSRLAPDLLAAGPCVSRKSSPARRAIMPRVALRPVWTSRWSRERSSWAHRSRGIRRLIIVDGGPVGRPPACGGACSLLACGGLCAWALLGRRGSALSSYVSRLSCGAWKISCPTLTYLTFRTLFPPFSLF
jgi:hypothetical protein